MSWTALLVLAAGAYGFKVFGLVLVGGSNAALRFSAVTALIPAALMAALIAVQTFELDGELVVDARALGVAVAIVATIRKLPLVVVVVLAMAVTAIARAAGVD